MSILEVIKSFKDEVFFESFFIEDHLLNKKVEKKMNNAISAYAKDASPKSVLLIVDTTLLGSAKEGLLFTTDSLYLKLSELHKKIPYGEIMKIKHVTKEDEEFLKIFLSNGEIIEIPSFYFRSLEKFKDFLLKLKEAYLTSDKSKISENIPLEEMPSEVKMSYIKIVINFALENDNKINEIEMREILSLIYRLNFNSEERFELFNYMSRRNTESDYLEETKKLVEAIEAHLSELSLKNVVYSLLKDLLFLKIVVQKDTYSSEILSFLIEKFNISEDKIEFFENLIKNEQKIYQDDVDDDALKEFMSDVISTAGALGIPLAAIFLTGSVTGLSAASITSGLAFLGFGGILGLSSMATGIGTAIALGILTQKGLKKLTGSDEIEKARRKEFFLQEIIKQTQRTINGLMEDINYFAAKLEEAIKIGKKQEKQIEMLSKALEFLSKGGTALSKKIDMTEKAKLRIRIPKELNVEKLKNLTSEPTKKDFRQYVLNFYEKQQIKENGEIVEKFILKQDISREDLEKLTAIFENIGYFKLEGLTQDVKKRFLKWFTG